MGERDLEALVSKLEESGEYRILRKLSPRREMLPYDESPTKSGLFVDVETTGLDPERDEIIELAMVPFRYASDGRIFSTEEPFQSLREPGCLISEEITAITGIDHSMVAGKVIDPRTVADFIEGVDLVVAHNASFDRRFLERFCPHFIHKPWACSNSQISWRAEGFEGTRLAYLVAGAGFFYNRHRALNDCYAAIELLATRLPRSNALAMAKLLEAARTPLWRIWASGAPYDLKDVLKSRGYKWNAEGQGPRRAWFIDVLSANKDTELRFLQAEIYRREIDIPMREIDAYDRFSVRS